LKFQQIHENSTICNKYNPSSTRNMNLDFFKIQPKSAYLYNVGNIVPLVENGAHVLTLECSPSTITMSSNKLNLQ
jgi:hypothetical protein